MSTDQIDLRAMGKCWGRLSPDGRYLEVKRQDDRRARIDLVESARMGRAVVVPATAACAGDKPGRDE